MRRGCIAIGETRCDGCGRLLKHPDRYLIIEGEDVVEGEEGGTIRYCVDCCQEKGFAHYRMEKGERILTFLGIEMETQ